MRASKEFVEKYYTDDLAERDSAASQWAYQWIKEVSGDCVLDIGCGPQFFDDAVSFSKLPKEMVGVDLNESSIEFLKNSENPTIKRSKEILAKNGVRVEFFVHDIKIERPDFINRFDAVFASGVLEIFEKEDAKQILLLLYKYLKEGGKFIIVSWGDDRLAPEKLQERNNFSWYWRKGSGPEALRHAIEQTGFAVLKSGVHNVANPEEYEWGIIYSFVCKK